VADPDQFALGGPDRDCRADRADRDHLADPDHLADRGQFAVGQPNRVRPVDGNRLA
jgi:hypothetical protein